MAASEKGDQEEGKRRPAKRRCVSEGLPKPQSCRGCNKPGHMYHNCQTPTPIRSSPPLQRRPSPNSHHPCPIIAPGNVTVRLARHAPVDRTCSGTPEAIMAVVSLQDLPDEIVETILIYVPPLGLPAVSQAS